MAGIHRHVYLLARPRHLRIATFQARASITTPEKDTSTAQLCVDITLKSETNLPRAAQSKSYLLTVSLHGPGLNQPMRLQQPVDGTSLGDGRFSLEMDLKATPVKVWRPSHPHLYTVVLSLSLAGECASTCVQAEACSVGFRCVRIGRVEAAGMEMLLLNERRVQFRGANRHDHDPVLGDTVRHTPLSSSRPPIRHSFRACVCVCSWAQVPVARMVTDCLMLKALRFNAVRCSHYPVSPVFYELCSRCGRAC